MSECWATHSFSQSLTHSHPQSPTVSHPQSTNELHRDASRSHAVTVTVSDCMSDGTYNARSFVRLVVRSFVRCYHSSTFVDVRSFVLSVGCLGCLGCLGWLGCWAVVIIVVIVVVVRSLRCCCCVAVVLPLFCYRCWLLLLLLFFVSLSLLRVADVLHEVCVLYGACCIMRIFVLSCAVWCVAVVLCGGVLL